MAEKNIYPHTETLPGAPPQYDSTPVHHQAFQTITVAPSQQPQQNLYVVGGPAVPLGPQSCRVTCPSCGQVISTKIDYVNSTKTHLAAVLLGITFCCCCIPYCIDSCKNAQHTCPNCGAYLGTYNN